MPLVPEDFDVPLFLDSPPFYLEPAGPQHNQDDHAAWTSSIEHIHATPGFTERGWPPVDSMSPGANRQDLTELAADFAAREGFTYTVLHSETRIVIGSVGILPRKDGVEGAAVRSWVCESQAALDKPLWRLVSEWLAGWPLASVSYAAR
ncbi:N-acetyltransferase [Phytomonospora sp. NPDC050363]|uniref:N-acetyltransferase n=1 Tax=Phytomonospora sp. NPDC050363 TaxID=3155642 RepID=UPI0033C53F54